MLIIVNLNGFVLSMDQVDRFTISTIAGNGESGFMGDNGLATSAEISFVDAIVVATNGDLYIADKTVHRIRKVSNGIITTFAGSGSISVGGFSGDGQLATEARLNSPKAIAFNNVDGSLYIGDTLNYRIRKILSNQIISTIIGDGTSAPLTPGLAINSRIGTIFGIAVSPSGVVYFADSTNHCIGKIDGEIVSVAAGICSNRGYSGDGDLATSSTLNQPNDAAVSPVTGELFIVDTGNHVIRKVGNDNRISTFAGTGGVSGYSGDGGQAQLARLRSPASIAFSSTGEMFIADTSNYVIRKVSQDGVIRTVAGIANSEGYAGDGFDSLTANFEQIYSLSYSLKTNELVLADSKNHRIRKLSPTSCNGISWRNTSVCSSKGDCTHTDNCACQSGYSGNDCHLYYCFSIEKDSASACSGRGRCDSPNNCTCFDNTIWTGSQCNTPVCFGIQKDHPSVCSGFGECSSPDNCSCQEEYYGANCSTFYCFGIEKSESFSCSGNGVCSSHNNCSCNEDYYGDNCDLYYCFLIEHNSTSVCSSNGECTSPNNCTCLEGYYGSNCESFDCFGTSNSINNVCSGHGICSGPDKCVCHSGYFENNCQDYDCYGIIHNQSNVCSGHGDCIEKDLCNCTTFGYYGSDCSVYTCNGVLFNDSHVCSSNGSCISQNNCSCNHEFYGTYCELFDCFEVQNLHQSVCHGNGRCMLPNLCSCEDGYYGFDCGNFSCYNYSQGSDGACSSHGDCIAPDNCTCKGNYYGSECELFDCFGYSFKSLNVCTNGQGSCKSPNHCECREGYYGDECDHFYCFGLMDLSNDTCSGNGVCQQLNSCVCYQNNMDGYWDGENCDKCLHPYFGVECKTTPCSSPSSCSYNGECQNNGTCICFSDAVNGYWKGTKCDICDDNYYGAKCQMTLTSTIRFSNYGDKLLLETQGFIPSSDIVDCNTIIQDLSALGFQPTCRWNSSTFMIILGKDFTIGVNQSIFISPMVLGGSSSGSFTEMIVEYPISPTTPIAIINMYSLCDDFMLDGSQSTSQDSKSASLEWSIVSSSEISKLIPVVHQANNHSASSLYFRYNDYSRGIHIFKLKVRSILFATQSETMFTVNINYDPLPPITIRSRSVRVNEMPLINKKILNPKCFSSEFSYSISYTKTEGPELSYSMNSNKNLVISSFSTFENSNYNFQVDLSHRNRFISSRFTTTFSVKSMISPTTVQIFALEATSKRYTLGYGLFDPDSLPEVENVRWGCLVNGEPCSDLLDLSGNTVIISRPHDHRLLNVSLEIFLHVTKGFRNASSSLNLIFPFDETFGVPPIISLLHSSHTLNTIKKGEFLNLQVGFQGVEDLNRIQRNWRINGTSIDQNMVTRMRTSLSDSNSIIIDTGFLEEGVSYILSLRIDDLLTGLSSTLFFPFTILKFPKACECFVSPSFGFPLSTEFTFRCPNCETEESFEFEYGFIDAESRLSIPIALSPATFTNKSVVQYLPGSSTNHLQVYVKILDTTSGADMKIISSVEMILPNVTGITELESLISKWSNMAALVKQTQSLGINIFNSGTISSLVSNIRIQLMNLSLRRQILSDIDTLIHDFRSNLIKEFSNEEINRYGPLNPLSSESFSTFIFTAFSLVDRFNSVRRDTLSLLIVAIDKSIKEAHSNKNIVLLDGVDRLSSRLISFLYNHLDINPFNSQYDDFFLRFSLCISDMLKRRLLLGGNAIQTSTSYTSITTNRHFPDELSELTISSDIGKLILPNLPISGLRPWGYSLLFMNNRAFYESEKSIQSERTKVTTIVSTIKSHTTFLNILNENDQPVNLNNLTSPIMYFIPLIEAAGINSTNTIYTYECKNLSGKKILSAPSCIFSLVDNTTGLCACHDNIKIGVLETKVEHIFLEEPNLPQFLLSEGDIVWIPLILMAVFIVFLIFVCCVYVLIGCLREEKTINVQPEMKYKNFALNPKFAKKLVKVKGVDLLEEENVLDGEWKQ